MRACAALAERLRTAASCAPARGDESQWARDAACQQAYLEMAAALEDDFHTPRALAALDQLAAHTLEVRAPAQIATLRELAGVLGLRLGAEDDAGEAPPPLLCAVGEPPLPPEE